MRKHRPKRTTSLIAMVAALAMVLGACGTDDAPEETDDAPEETDDAPEETEEDDPADDDAEAADGDLVIDGDLIADAATLEAALAEGPLNAYQAYAEAAMNQILEIFTEDTGIEVDFLQQPTGQLVERVLTEWGADALPADLILLPLDANLNAFEEAGIWSPYEVPNHDAYSDEFTHPERLYYKPVTGSSTLAFNNALIPEDEGPQSYQDLLDPELRGRIGLVPITQGATGYTFWKMLYEEFGVEYWEQMAEQDVLLQPGTGPLHDELTRGEFPVAVGRPPIIGTQIDDGAPLTMVFPEGELTPGWTWGAGIVEGAERRNAAEVYMNWLLSKRGQEAFALASGDFPTHPEAPSPVVLGEPLPTPDFHFHQDTDEEVQEFIALWEEIFDFAG